MKKELSGRVLAEGCRVDPYHSDYGPMTGSCENSDELLGSSFFTSWAAVNFSNGTSLHGIR
jgi:hypothetical protein